MDKIELTAEDFLKVAQVRAQEDPTFALQVKCIALIRMLEESEQRYRDLEEKVNNDG